MHAVDKRSKLGPVVAAVVLSIFSAPIHVNAEDASKLYFEAESAIKDSEGNFRVLKSEWSNTKRVLSSNLKESEKSDNLMQNVKRLLQDAEQKISSEVSDATANAAQLEATLQTLTAATEAKYADAEAASAVPTTKPGILAKKFQDAKNAAAVVDKETSTLKVIFSVVEKSKAEVEKLQEVISRTQESDAAITAGRGLQSQALEGMETGLSRVYSMCEDSLYFCSDKENNGVVTFKTGLDKLAEANDKFFTKTLTQLRIGDNSLKTSVKSLESIRDILSAQTAAVEDWEKETKLNARNGKAAISSAYNKLDAAIKSVDNLSDKFDKMATELSTTVTEDKTGLKAARSTFDSLQKTEGGARRAESKLKQAKEAGEREASKYLKKVAKSKIIISAEAAATASIGTPK